MRTGRPPFARRRRRCRRGRLLRARPRPQVPRSCDAKNSARPTVVLPRRSLSRASWPRRLASTGLLPSSLLLQRSLVARSGHGPASAAPVVCLRINIKIADSAFRTLFAVQKALARHVLPRAVCRPLGGAIPGNQISVNFIGLALSLQGLPGIAWVGRAARKRTKDRRVLRNWLCFSA